MTPTPFALALLAFGVASCRHAAVGPEAVFDAYARAIAAGRLDEAYALLASDYKKAHDRAAFERAVKSPDGRGVARLRARTVAVELQAEVELSDGDRLPLVSEHGQWRLARDPLDFYPQKTPLEALRSFIRAVENHRYDVVYRFVPNRYRANITVDKLRDRWEGERREELLGQLFQVRAHLSDPLEVSGDEAHVTVGERKQARLVHEDDVWKVETLE
jgi:hypothetical protein